MLSYIFQPPFSILNSFGILDAKIDSENILIERLERLNAKCIVIRPGRLVGEPFTNFDLAKLLKLDQGDKKGIAIDTRDVLSGDIERADVAETLSRLLRSQISERVARFSIINTPGPAPSESQWGKLLSLFTVSQSDMLTTRKSNE